MVKYRDDDPDGSRHDDETGKRAAAEYIRSMVVPLQTLAVEQHLDVIAFLLAMAKEEATLLSVGSGQTRSD